MSNLTDDKRRRFVRNIQIRQGYHPHEYSIRKWINICILCAFLASLIGLFYYLMSN